MGGLGGGGGVEREGGARRKWGGGVRWGGGGQFATLCITLPEHGSQGLGLELNKDLIRTCMDQY